MTSTSSVSPAVLDTLRRVVPADAERTPRAYAIDGIEPRLAFAPMERGEVARLLRAVATEGLTATPQGSRTALAMGNPLAAYDVAIDLRGMHRMVEYVPDDLTMTVEAGTTLAAVQATLAEHGQYLTVDPPPDDQVTIGGLLATARPGAWRGCLPAARDLVLGITAALPSGDLVKSGGRVVKNVTGYDMHRMHTGALGAFGIIVEASFKVAPLPAAVFTLAAPASDLGAAVTLARAAWDAGVALRAVTVLSPEAAGHIGLWSSPTVLVELAGSQATVDHSARDLAALGRFNEAPPEGWAYIRRLHGDQESTVLRIGVPPSAIRETMEAARTLRALTWAHVASGTVVAHFADTAELSVQTLATLRTTAERHGGYLQIEAAPPQLRTAAGPGGPGDIDLVTALRDQFDPTRSLNRGRWGANL